MKLRPREVTLCNTLRAIVQTNIGWNKIQMSKLYKIINMNIGY